MSDWSNLLLGGAVVVVALVVVLGLVNLLRGADAAVSQRLMRWRVGLQFAAVLLIVGILYFRG
jgi:CHASE2 domain-containing sensor protein